MQFYAEQLDTQMRTNKWSRISLYIEWYDRFSISLTTNGNNCERKDCN